MSKDGNSKDGVQFQVWGNSSFKQFIEVLLNVESLYRAFKFSKD